MYCMRHFHYFPGLALVFLLLLTGRGGWAQPAAELPPVGGWPLRPVQTLRLVPEPPGGLIPYRKGQRWGYADTTGRIWIKPVLVDQPPELLGGVARVNLRTKPRRGPERKPSRSAKGLLNARGELLVAPPRRSVRFVLLPDSSLAGRPEAQALGMPGLQGPVLDSWQRLRWEVQPVSHSWSMPGRLTRFPFQKRRPVTLGEGYFSAVRWQWWKPTVHLIHYGRCGSRHPEKRYPYSGAALFNARGRRLTRYGVSVGYFKGGRAVYSVALPARDGEQGAPPRRYGLLDGRGRRITPPRFLQLARQPGPRDLYWAQELSGAGEVLYGIVDSAGHYTIPAQPNILSGVDTEGFVAEVLRGERVRLRRADGRRTAFDTVSYEGAAPFWRGRAIVKQGGRYGLLDTAGRWNIPPVYESLTYYTSAPLHASRNLGVTDPVTIFSRFGTTVTGLGLLVVPAAMYPVVEPGAPDSVVLAAKRGGKYGVVGYYSGRELVTPAFDTELCLLRHGAYGIVDRHLRFVWLAPAAVPTSGPTVAPATGRLSQPLRVRRTFGTRHGYRFWVEPADRPSYSVGGGGVIDSSGRLLTPWFEPDDLSAVQVLDDYVLCHTSTDDQLFGPGSQLLYQSQFHALRFVLTEDEQATYLAHAPDLASTAPVGSVGPNRPLLIERCPEPQEPARYQVLDAQLRILTGRAYGRVTALAGGWCLLYKDGAEGSWSTNYEVLTPQGRLLTGRILQQNGMPPLITNWSVLRTTAGYLTRGGRELWED